MNKSGGFFPKKGEINKAINTFSYAQMFLFLVLIIAAVASFFLIADKINEKYLIERPLAGGRFTEGVIGSPRFVNPVLATSSTDRDLVRLIFSGLVKKNPVGEIEPDLAEEFNISEDGLTYTFILKEDLTFHDGAQVSADDIVFTIQKIQDGKLKSPYQGNWQNIRVSKTDERTVEFKLSSPYSGFLENLSSVGILPLHIWGEIDVDDFTFSNHNINAIGTGPYKIHNIKTKKNGLIESITLKPFKNYAQEKAYISRINFLFFRNEDELSRALQRKKIDQMGAISGLSAETMNKYGYNVQSVNLSRIFGLFLNSNKQEIFRNKNITKAIDLAIDKEAVVKNVLGGYGTAIDSPIPEKLYSKEKEESMDMESRIEEANSILSREGWVLEEDGTRKKGDATLGFSISTGDAPELQTAASMIKDDLEKVGISVEVKVFEMGNLNQSVIRPRDYDSLFFGQIVTSESDLFAFWHSSQRNDPGLNISSYTNNRVDGLLDRIIASKDAEEKNNLFADLESEIKKDYPAIFIYSPDFVYVVDEKIQNIILDKINTSSERFTHVNKWFMRTEKIWNFIK
jgi:peptide/nickel transport system substrate-binding protein